MNGPAGPPATTSGYCSTSRNSAHKKPKNGYINDKKRSKQAEEGVEVAEEVGAGEVAKETQTKRNEAHKTDRQLAGSSEG